MGFRISQPQSPCRISESDFRVRITSIVPIDNILFYPLVAANSSARFSLEYFSIAYLSVVRGILGP